MKRPTVADVMTRSVVTVAEDTPFAEIASAVAVLDDARPTSYPRV